MSTSRQRRRARDEIVYAETDHMGEGELPRFISELLRPLLARFLAGRGKTAHVRALIGAKPSRSQR